MRSSGTIFVHAINLVLQPPYIQEFTKSFVDDMTVHFDDWNSHLLALDNYFNVMNSGGFSLSLKKCIVMRDMNILSLLQAPN